MPPPYNEDDIDFLYTLVETEGEAPESWPTYSAKIRGHAKTYSDALKRLKVLENEDCAFTADSDGEPQIIKTKKVENQFKARKLVVSEETRNAMNVPSISTGSDSDEETDDHQYLSSSDETSVSKINRKKIPSKSGPRNRTKNSSPLPKPNKVDSGKQKPSSHQKPPISGTISNKTCSEGKKDDKNNTERAQTSAVDEKSNNKNKERNNYKSGECSNSNKTSERSSNNKSLKDRKSDIVMMLAILKGITVDLKEIKANQQVMMQQLHSTDYVMDQNFTAKHNLSIPFKTISDFSNFDTQLSTTDEFRTEFISSLNSLLDRELCLIKSCTNVLKKHLSRDLIKQFTAARRMPGKSLIKPTMFYDCVLSVMTQTHKDVLTGRAINEQVFLSAIGRVFNNAKDWDGQRQKRALLQAPELELQKQESPCAQNDLRYENDDEELDIED